MLSKPLIESMQAALDAGHTDDSIIAWHNKEVGVQVKLLEEALTHLVPTPGSAGEIARKPKVVIPPAKP